MTEHNSGPRRFVPTRHSGGVTQPPNLLQTSIRNAAHLQHIKKQGAFSVTASKKKLSIPTDIRRVQKEAEEIITYVLDTNVLMGDWSSLFKFKEHTVCLVSQVLNELDNHKKGRSDEAFNVRRTIRALDGLLAKSTQQQIQDGIVLTPPGEISNGVNQAGKLIFYYAIPQVPAGIDVDLSYDNPDDRIIMACLAQQHDGRRVVLVSNDVNCRVKAVVCGLETEEYLNDAITASAAEENVVTGFHNLGDDFWEKLGENFNSWQEKQVDCYEFNHKMFKHVHVHQFLLLPDNLYLRVIEKPSPHKVVAITFSHHNYSKVAVQKNIEQGLALELLLDTDLSAVSLAGKAGSGKTYLALAAAMHLMLDKKEYDRVIVTRSAIDADEKIGFLPGTEVEKMSPWLGGIFDNLESLIRNNDSSKQETATTVEYLMRLMRMQIKSLTFMKGRNIERTLIIVDEAQDLNRSTLKMISTRVGFGSKIIYLGNVAQIDNPLVTENTCGMSILISAFADSKLMGHVTLQQGERSAFATEAEERL